MKAMRLAIAMWLAAAAAASGGAAEAKSKFVPETYRNPIGWADVPDVSMCSDGKCVYMVSTTMHLCPGAPIMRTGDMVNWEVVGYVFDKFPQDNPRYDLLDDNNCYGAGQWAASLAYHGGKFWCWFIMNGGGGGYLYTADKAEGPWELYSSPGFMHDGALFFDDDGSAYIAHGDGWITALTDDLKTRDCDKFDFNDIERGEETALLEGTAMFKHDGYYYRMMVSAFLEGHWRREVCYRAKNLRGPWEKKVLLELNFDRYNGVGQGCVVQHRGEWWALVFQDRGGVGRVPCLMPVVWKDGWPMLGNERGDAIPNDATKGYADVSGYIRSDNFDKPQMDIVWQWNHQPVNDAWSLTERKGWLRLKTSRVVKNLFMAPNTLTQRTCGPVSTAEVTLDYSNIKEGDWAGLALFQSRSATLGVELVGGKYYLVMRREMPQFEDKDGKYRVKTVEIEEMERIELKGKEKTVHLKAKVDYHAGADWGRMAWSADGKRWKPIGREVKMVFDIGRMFMGAKFALYCYATKETGGWADFDDFKFETFGHEKKGKTVGRDPFVEQFPLGRVALGEGPMKERQAVDIDYLLNTVKVDRLLAEFRNVAGLGEKDKRYPNRWEGGQINGHSLGHYLSAVSALYAVADDKVVKAKAKEKVDYIVDELAECQKANGNGFLMTCPQEIYEKVKSGDFTTGGFDINRWWVPNYTLHKVFAGLRDAYRWGGSKKALEVERKLGDWYYGIVKGLSPELIRKLLVSEWGGLNETFANLADDTGDRKYTMIAQVYFDDCTIFDPLKIGVDVLDGRHANTQVPKIAGLARLYEQTGDEGYRTAVETFWDSVVNRRSFANGGHSDDEHFYPMKENVKKLGPHNNETCNINNMLRLTAHTFGWRPVASQMDFVERGLYNQIMAQIGRKPGEFGYFLSQAPVGEKVWSTPEGAWWCCVGTGMENPMHYTDHVYYRTRDDATLYVNLFAPTTLDWKEKGVKIEQKTAFPYGEESTLTVKAKKPAKFALKVRRPYWCKAMVVKVNGESQAKSVLASDGYWTISREWKDGDKVELELPMTIHASVLPNSDGTRAAFMYGPLVIVGEVPPEEGKVDNAARRWDDHLAAPGKTLEAAMTVVTTNLASTLRLFKKTGSTGLKKDLQDSAQTSESNPVNQRENPVNPVFSSPLRFTAKGLLQPRDLVFMPLMDVYEEHYTTYFPVMTPRKWKKVAAWLAEEQKAQAAEEARKIDEVFPGFQQSEVNHDMKADFSGVGEAYGQKWRNSIGVFGRIEYTLAVDGKAENELVIRVSGDDADQRYDIYIDDAKLARESHSRLKPGSTFDLVYALPRAMTDGKDKVRVSVRGFPDVEEDGVKQPNTGSGWIGGFFYFGTRHPAPKVEARVEEAKVVKPPMPPLHIEGKYLVDDKGFIARYRGTMQSLSPFFSGGRWGGGEDEDAAKRCVAYMKELVDMLSDREQGSWYNMLRLTDDAYWCGRKDYRGSDRMERFDFERHKWYVGNVLVPIVEYAVSKGIYVIVRPSMNTEQDTHVGDDLQRHFVKEWRQIASNSRLQALSGWVAFELENEPVNVRNADNEDDPTAIADYMQPMIDAIRKAGFKGVIWVPGAGFQSLFQGYMSKMVTDPLDNFGFAAHIYPGWYGQEDYRTTPETFLARLLAQIPVLRDHAVAVTECDWSPEKPGQGKFNEFGDWVPANYGSWGTATTRRWGKSLRSVADRLGNLSMMIGGVDEVLDVDLYLRTAGLKPGHNGMKEACSAYALEWYRDWATEKKVRPADFDKTRLKPLAGQKVRLNTVKQLSAYRFQMVTEGAVAPDGPQGNTQLQLPAEGDDIPVGFGPAEPTGRIKAFVHLFKVRPVKVDGAVHYRLSPCFPDGVLRLSRLEWGNGDSLYVGKGLSGLYEGACLPRSEHKVRYGQDADFDALWDIEAATAADGKAGFTFRNVATGRYLGTAAAPCSEAPVVWTCFSRR